MKNCFRVTAATLCSAVLFVALQGCLKDSVRESYKIYSPVYQTLTQVRAGMKSGPAQPLQNTGKLNVFGNFLFLNEINKGIHVIDNTNPAAPKNIAFINIPNNVDLAVKGSYLYANSYSDVVVFDISQPVNIRPVKFLDNIIKDKNQYWYANQKNPDSIRVVVGYAVRDTVVDYKQYKMWNSCANCMFATANLGGVFYTSVPQTGVGVGGSTSRFSIVNDYLYAVSNSELYTISIADPANPQQTSTRNMGWNIETIYPFQNNLFIGSRNGMFVYDLSNPSSPTQVSQFTHATSCDPVISDGSYAYVTLHTGTVCNGNANELDVIDIANLSAPVLKKTIAMSSPCGLSKDGDALLVCDGKYGLKLFDVSAPTNPQLKKQVDGLETSDVIALNGTAIVVAKDGLYQFAYGNGNLAQLSKLSIETKN